jgi:deazaflavin-dependent oxidoreductase (nitroreductase family)
VTGIFNTRKAGAVAMINQLGATRFGVWMVKHILSPLQRSIYSGSGGRVFSTIGSGRKVLLLTTIGRRTGRDRTTPIFYLRDGESVILCNVNPPYERTNPCVVNLHANPAARLQIGRKSGLYHARQASEAEIQHYWPELVALWPAYQLHFERGGRRSIFILEPQGDRQEGLGKIERILGAIKVGE